MRGRDRGRRSLGARSREEANARCGHALQGDDPRGVGPHWRPRAHRRRAQLRAGGDGRDVAARPGGQPNRGAREGVRTDEGTRPVATMAGAMVGLADDARMPSDASLGGRMSRTSGVDSLGWSCWTLGLGTCGLCGNVTTVSSVGIGRRPASSAALAHVDGGFPSSVVV